MQFNDVRDNFWHYHDEDHYGWLRSLCKALWRELLGKKALEDGIVGNADIDG